MTEARLPSQDICIVLLSGIGDVVHGLPVVNALKRDDPDRCITWVVQSEPAPLLRSHPSVDEVITFDRKQGLAEVRSLRRKLRSLRFDVVLNFNIYFKSAVPTFFARAPNKISFGRDRARDLVWLFANNRLPPSSSRHTQDRFLEFLAYLDVAPNPIEWRITFTRNEREAQRDFFSRLEGRPSVGIVPTAGRSSKDWPVGRYALLATALERDYGFRVILLGGPGRREQERARELAEISEASLEPALGHDLRRLAYLVEACDLLITPDTGPLHIARALGTPVIGLFGHTDPTRIGPYRAYEDLWVDRYNYDGPDEPSDFTGSAGREGRMPLITVADVLDRVAGAMDRYLKPARSGQHEV